MPFYGARVEPDGALTKGYRALIDAITYYNRNGQRAKAIACREILGVMWAEYEALSIRGAAKGTAFVRSRIRTTQVRPDASGRLMASIESHPLPSLSGFPGGGIGIASLEALDHGVVNPGARDKGEYWRAQEHGTTAHVGRVIPGYFQAGNASPNPAEFRQHPYFVAASSQAGQLTLDVTPMMTIRRPLRARHFVRDGSYEAGVWYTAQERKILDRAVAALRALPSGRPTSPVTRASTAAFGVGGRRMRRGGGV